MVNQDFSNLREGCSISHLQLSQSIARSEEFAIHDSNVIVLFTDHKYIDKNASMEQEIG